MAKELGETSLMFLIHPNINKIQMMEYTENIKMLFYWQQEGSLVMYCYLFKELVYFVSFEIRLPENLDIFCQ